MSPESERDQDVLESLADGTPIDWAALEGRASEETERRRYRNLRLIAHVAEFHKTLSLSEADGDALAETSEAPWPGRPPAITRWGHLEVGAPFASGAFGTLYRARDPQLDRDVALKLLRPRDSGDRETARLLSEARVLARVSHPNVVVIHGADVRDGLAGLWMELVDGVTLESLVRDHGPLGAGEVVAIGRDLCRAVAAVHAASLVHGDIKPQNVMREAGGRIVLMDFGSGRLQGANEPATGTPLYLAPEVLAGSPATRQSDVYSLGVLLFHLLTKRYPFEAGSIEALRRAHADGRRLHLRDLRPELPDALVDCVERALETNPTLRFPSAGAMERALAERRLPRRRIVLAAAGILAAAVLVVGLPRLGTDTTVRSMGVLPFKGAGDDLVHVAEGLANDVVRELQQFDVQVRRAIYAGVGPGSTDLDSRLGSDAILSADATRDSNVTRLRVQLRRAGAAPFWVQEYEIEDNRLPAIARTIAQDVAAAVGARRRSDAPPPARETNYRAYEAYQRGRLLAEQRTPSALMRSLEYFREAVRLDPDYAEPWAGMADTYLALGVPPFGGLRPIEARRLAKEAALKALELKRDLPEAYTSLAWAAALYDWDWQASENWFRQAITLNPQYALAHHWYAMLLTDMGRFDEARRELATAQALEPLSLLIDRDFGWIDFCEAKYDDAVRQLRETLARDPQYVAAMTLLARSLAETGLFNEALSELERARPHLTPGAYLSFRGYIEARAGDPGAPATLHALRDVARSEYVTPYYLALIYTALGQKDQAVSELERAFAEQDATLGSINIDPRFEAIRPDPRFQKIITDMRFPAPRR